MRQTIDHIPSMMNRYESRANARRDQAVRRILAQKRRALHIQFQIDVIAFIDHEP
jgi:hypothetical protein